MEIEGIEMNFEPIELTITFRKLLEHDACSNGYNRLADALGGDEAYGMDKPINLLSCLDSNPLEDVIWALRATEQDSSVPARLFAADCAESVLHIYESAYANDRRPREAIEAARAFARGEIDGATLAAAGDAARDAARAVAADAAWAAARAAAWAAAGAAARAAAWAAAWAAAGDAAWAAGDAEKAKQVEFLRRYIK